MMITALRNNNKPFKIVTLAALLLGLIAAIFAMGGAISTAAATSPNPLDDGGWELVAHMSNNGGMFDGNGELMPGYAYGTFNSNPAASTPDFQRAFPVVADKILFITGDLSIWGIADYGDLRALIDDRGSVFSPNLVFEIGVGGVKSNTTGNVLSRPGVLEDPWISIDGDHSTGIANQRIVWGENDWNNALGHVALKNNHGGINVYVKAPTLQFSTDFNSGVPAEFSGVTSSEGVQGYAGLGTDLNVFGGDFLRNGSLPDGKTTLSLTGLPPHDGISLSYLLAIIDSWDGDGCFAPQKDIFNVSVDGLPIFSEVLDNSYCGAQSYVPPVGVELAYRAALGFNTDGNPPYGDSAYDMGLDPTFQNIPHTSSTLTIEWFTSGGNWQGGTDESWAIDNVVILVDVYCPVGYYGVVDCQPAQPGTFVDTPGALVATDCPKGFYQDLEGQTSCKKAPAGSFVDTEGATMAIKCSPGYYQDAEGSLECKEAPVGTYVQNAGSAQATACPAGSTTASTASTSLSDCNYPPTADAGGPYLVAVQEQFDFIAGPLTDDPEGESPLTEAWTADGVALVDNTYTAGNMTGIYDVCLIVTDVHGLPSEEDCTMVVVYDPSGGFVTGGGWINSPAGAYTPEDETDPEPTGKASFGFVSKYKKGASTPTGDTNFQFKAGDLHFKSTSYEWLVIAGANAKYMGEGTINGTGNYGFMLTATDSDVQGGGDFDAFRIRIWNLGSGGGTVYDNQHGQDVNGEAGTVLGGGNIKIHKAK